MNDRTTVSSLSPSLPSNEFNALWDFYNSLNGDHWYWSNMTVRWNFSESNPNPCSGWYGLTCNCTVIPCHLTELIIPEFGLNGSLPSTMGAWKNLLQFEVNGNSITGTIPESIGNWTALEALDMGSNGLRGEIPISIGNVTNLQVLILSYNQLTGILPSFQNIPNLEEVYLDRNLLFGPFPQSIANLCCLLGLFLDYNLFSGTIPPLLSLSTLMRLDLSSNLFVGGLESFRNMHNIVYLSVQINFLSGDCAADLNTISKIGSLSFAQNLFSGRLPLNSSWMGLYEYYAFDNYFGKTISEEFLNITNLQYFSVGGNYLTGTILQYFRSGQLPRLFSLNTSSNLLTGSLPSEIKSFSSLTQLLFNNNFFTGSVPSSFSNFTFLIDLWLNDNDLTGTLPFPLAVFSSLKEFFIQSNFFTGSVSDLLFIPLAENSTCTDIDLSNNLFTGSLVASFFSSQTSLETFAAVNNCLKGTIPVEICNLEYLTTLALDGMSTAENCRTLFFPGTIFTGFYTSHALASTVPSCMFLLPSLKTLHLSGNGFSGSIASSLNISQSLVDLSLSNNQLTGSIPESLQMKIWQNLDLSYNKISGTLSNSFSLIPSNGLLYLEVNRLSGIIPTQLINVQSINILQGNIFSCNSNADLPIHDPSRHIYSCASDSVDNFLYLWISCFVIAGTVLILFCYAKMRFGGGFHPEEMETKNQEQSNADELKLRRSTPFEILLTSVNTLDHWRCSFAHYCDRNPFGNLSVLRRFFRSTWKGFALIGLATLVFFLPVYSVLTPLTSTYQFEYAWSVSAILLSGELAAVTLFVLFFIILVLFVLVLLYILYDTDLNAKTTGQISIQQQSKIPFLDFISFVASKNYKSRDETIKEEHSHKLSWLVYIAVTVVDLVLYGFADISYVIIVITYNSTVTDFAVVSLAVYKFFANDFILSKSIPFMMYLIDNSFPRLINETDLNKSFVRRVSDYRFTILDITFLEHLMLVNHVVLPIVSVMVVLPDCFYNAFFAASPTSSSYSFQDSVETNSGGSVYTLNQQTVFTPPFFYSYQCASKVLISFVPLYIMKFCYVGFLRPLKHLLVKRGYDYYYTKSGERSKLWKAFRYFLPTTLQNLQSEVSSRQVYQKLSITIQLSSYFAIILVFGTLFPPLAVLGSVSVLSMIFVEVLLLGRVLYESSRAGYDWYKQRLEDDCGNIRETILVSAQSTLFISCCFFAFLLFDTWGDKNGWRSALPIACCILVPCLLFRLYQMCQSIKFNNSSERRDENARNRYISEDQVEMGTSTSTENPLQRRTVLADTGEI
jgi:Leucine-rich repeat (LRR) protein